MAIPVLMQAQTSADVSTDKSSATPKTDTKAGSQDSKSPDVDKRNRQLTDKEKKEREKAFKKEVGAVYKKWLDEDVRYIITD